MTSYSILIIASESAATRTMEISLRTADYHVHQEPTAVRGLHCARREPPDLVVLDGSLPGQNSVEVFTELRADPLLASIPVLFLTSRSEDGERIGPLPSGVDDYLIRPFYIDDLLLRVRALLRRAQAGRRAGSQDRPVEQLPFRRDSVLRVGPFRLNTRTFEFSSPQVGKKRLTPVQYNLLYHLMSHPGVVFSPARLLDEVWDYPPDAGSPDLVRVHIKKLRERVESDPRHPAFIKTVTGFGYTVEPPAA